MPERALLGRTKTIEVVYEGERVTVTYVPARITPRWEMEFTSALQDEWKSRAVVETLAAVVERWDLTDGGEPYPPTVENLMQLPVDFLIAVFTAIMEAQAPNRRNGASSVAG